MIDELKKELESLADKKYQIFSLKLLPNTKNVLGVRLPVLRKIAKRISKSNYKIFLVENDYEFMELALIEAMVIGLIKDIDEAYALLEKFIPKITNWSICDTLCASCKFLSTDIKRTRGLLDKYLNSEDEFEIRFCYVVLLMYFIDIDYEYVRNCLINFKNENYYAKMAAAWCLSVCLVKNFNMSLSDIKRKSFHPWVLKKGLTKAIESYRLNDFQKKQLYKLRNLN